MSNDGGPRRTKLITRPSAGSQVPITPAMPYGMPFVQPFQAARPTWQPQAGQQQPGFQQPYPAQYMMPMYPQASTSSFVYPQPYQQPYSSAYTNFAPPQPALPPLDGFNAGQNTQARDAARPQKQQRQERARPPPAAPQPRQSGGPVKCQLEGCSFSGSRKQVQEHEEDRHLIYAPGREPKPYVPKATSTIPIEGTSIKLDTPEAIEAWRAERRKKWPTKDAVDEKKKQEQERGVSSRGRGRGDRGRGRGRGRGGPTGWNSSYPRAGPPTSEPSAVAPAKRARSPGAASASSASSEEEDDVDEEARYRLAQAGQATGDQARATAASAKPTQSQLSEDDNDDDDEPPEEATVKQTVDTSVPNEPDSKKINAVCKYWRQGRCQHGDSCHFQHQMPERPPAGPKIHRPAPPQPKANPFDRPDLFLQMQERDIQQTVSDIMHVIEFLDRNDYLRKVERYAGECDEKSGVEEIK